MIAGITASTRRRASAVLMAPTDLVATLVEPPPPLPTVIGEPYGGGYYIGDITVADGGADDGTYAVIMAGSGSYPTLAWKNPRSATVGTDSLTNGLANTLAMQADDPAIHFAGMYCLEYTGGGHDDWYLPALNELELAWENITHLELLNMETTGHWSSSQADSNSAWGLYYSNGSAFNGTYGSKVFEYWVRPVRRIKRY